MSRASNSLLVSDVTATPIKVKYSASYDNTTICDSGIYAQSGLNGPVTVTGSVPQRTLRYLSVRHLFYSNYLTGSYQTTTSSFDSSLQSTAASGTFEGNTTLSASADMRYFPTESLAKIKIINIPKSSFGEKVSRKSFALVSKAPTGYNIVDDGNGNLIDTLRDNVYVGNILYSQGFAIITNEDYYCIVDGGPHTFPHSYVYDISDTPKLFNPIADAQEDCAPIDPNTLSLVSAPGYLFPNYTQDAFGNITLDDTDIITNTVGDYRDFYTVKSTYCASSDKLPINVSIIDVAVYDLIAIDIEPIPTPTPTPTTSVTATPTLTTSIGATATATPTPTPTPTIGLTQTPTPTQTLTQTETQTPTPTQTLTQTETQTPTPTPTPTPSTPVVADCNEYYNNSGIDQTGISYTDCNGTVYNNITVPTGGSICCQGNPGGGGSGNLTFVGTCGTYTP